MNGLKRLRLKDLASYAFMKVYYWMYISILFLGSTIIGLGVFSIVPSLMASFIVARSLASEKHKVKVKVFRLYKESFITYFKKYWLASLGATLLIFIISFDILYFSTGVIMAFNLLFIIFIILGFLFVNLIIIASYLRVAYENLELKNLFKNALAMEIVNMVDVLFMTVSSVGFFMILSKISGILLVIILPGIFINLSRKIVERILEKNSISYYIFNIK